MVSYEVAMGFAVVSSSDDSLTPKAPAHKHDRHRSGAADQGMWFIFKFFPLGLIAFFISRVLWWKRKPTRPFDLPEAESDSPPLPHRVQRLPLVSIFLAEYSAMIAVSSIAVTLWLGGWLGHFRICSTVDMGLVFRVLESHSCFCGLCFYSTARMPKHPYFRIKPWASPFGPCSD